MPKVNLIQTNFTAGELSPRMLGRVDVARYNNGAAIIENCIVLVHGGCLRRPGTEYIVPAKNADQTCRLVPYVFNVDQAYHLELGESYLRVFTADGEQIESAPGTPYELATPYTLAQVAELDVCQRADTMFIFHPDVPTQRLQRFADDQWRLMPVPWVTEPFDELGERPLVDLTLSAITAGEDRVLITTSDAFLASDIGRSVIAAGGIATITAYHSKSEVVATISHPFPSVSAAAGSWVIAGSPQSTVTPSSAGPIGTVITLSASSSTWRSSDVGKYVVINGGLVKITTVGSTTLAGGLIRAEMGAAVPAIPKAWALCRSMWGQEFGYPRTGVVYQQRLWVAGSPGFPQSAWMSLLGGYYDFEIGTEADSGFETRVDADQANPIRHLAASRAMVALTHGSEFTIRAAGDSGVKPGSIDVDPQSAFGCNDIQPVRAGNELLFVNATGRKVRAMSADRFDASNYAAPDITVLAEHITESGITAMASQADPEPLVWAVRADGKMAICTLDRDNDVVAWTRATTAGEFESVSVAPSGDSQVVLAVVKRDLGGAVKRSIEKFRFDLYTDASIEVSDETPFDHLTGLDYLEDETVSVRGDGAYLGDLTVNGGQIVLPREVTNAQLGLPFDITIELMNPEAAGPQGSAQGLMMRSPEVTILVKDTVGAQVNGREVLFGRFGEAVLDQPLEPYTGPERVELLGYERGRSDITITHTRPEPFHLLAVIRQLEING